MVDQFTTLVSDDTINACFELFSGFFILNHCRVLYKDKIVRGISPLSIVFFMVWGFWNLHYYTALDQPLSYFGGMFIVTANTIWTSMIFYYLRKEKKSLGSLNCVH